jgi:serine/threonine protein kinase
VQETGLLGTLNTVLRLLADPPLHTEPVTPARLARLCEGVARGLEYLHERHGFVHGGVSSYSVEVGRNDTPKLAVLDTDFGVSPQRWSAPSLLYGADLVAAHDVWAFGVMCIEVFSGGALP